MDDAPSPLTYTHRAKPYGAQAELKLTTEQLTISQGVVEVGLPLKDIVAIRLTYRPRNSTSEGYQAMVLHRGGKTITFSNLTFRNAFSIDRQDAPYRRFVIALVSAARAANPQLALMAGATPWKHWLSALLGAAAVLALALGSVTTAPKVSLPVAALLAVLTVYFGWWTWRFVSRNRPRGFMVEAIPEDVLPKDGSGE